MDIVYAYVLLRRDTAQNLRLSNPLLMEGEACWEMDTNKVKIGDGITRYNALPYFAGNVEELLQNYYTKDEITDILNTELVKKADVATTYTKTEVDEKIPTKTSELTNDSGFLTEHQHLKTINNQSIVGEGNIEIEGGGVTPTQVEEIVDDKLEGYATEQWVEDKNYITQHQSIKTINGESLVGEGNVITTKIFDIDLESEDLSSQLEEIFQYHFNVSTNYLVRCMGGYAVSCTPINLESGMMDITFTDGVSTMVIHGTRHNDGSWIYDTTESYNVKESSIFTGTQAEWDEIPDYLKEEYFIALISE